MEVNEQQTTAGALDIQAARQKLEGKRGRTYWRSLEEMAETPEFQQWMDDEFPNRSSLLQMNRRDLLKFMGASIALAGLSGCRGVFLPQDKVVPYVKQPEELVPGKPLFYASAVTLGGYATGVLVEQHEGRPIKIEGNPEHPASLGPIDSLSQAEVLSFYDPDRVGSVLNRTNYGQSPDIATWELFEAEIRKALAQLGATGGAGIRILTGNVTSPTFTRLMARFRNRFPGVKWHSYEPCGRANALRGAEVAYGRPLEAVYDFTKAKVVLSLDGDFLSPTSQPGSLRYAREFANGRRVTGFNGEMNRLYVVESTPTLVGAMADHRWSVRPSQVYANAIALAEALGVQGLPALPAGVEPAMGSEDLATIVADLTQYPGQTVVVTGDHQPIEVHALVHAINEQLGNVGRTIRHIAPVSSTADSRLVSDLGALVEDLNAGSVDLLLVVEGNPVYDAPSDLKFGDAILKAKTKVHLGQHDDETSALCDWHLPLAHSLEAWGDARAFDGTASIIQPLIAPIYEGRSAIEVISLMLGEPKGGYELVRETWMGTFAGDKEKVWRTAIHDGVIANSASPSVTAGLALNVAALPEPVAAQGMEIAFRPDPTIYDGRFANNGWLQELPKPLTKLTWDNAAILSPATAKKLGVKNDDRVELVLDGRKVEAAVFVLPGQPEDVVTAHLGYGRTTGGVVATAVPSENDDNKKYKGGGYNANLLRTAASMSYATGLQVNKLDGYYHIATTQGHQPIEGDRVEQFEGDHREVVIEHDLAWFNQHSKEEFEKRKEKSKEFADQNLYPEEIFVYNGPQWGMTIDMNTCIGCNACVTACQAENNIPVVGKEQVSRHREMHWINIDRYYRGSEENPQVSWQPRFCVHCEKAPCEPVCPVAATVHSHDGLNQMVYNRCVGTRYCSNNCPYKVRRFNYLNYTDNQKQFDTKLDEKPRIPLLRMLNNPNVTVRGRGVMEKCTYCVQRINDARIEAKKQNREVRDGEIVTACQQACPTNTIVFGNIADKESAVTALRNDPRAYLLLEELQTRPRTSHLAKLRNINPEIKTGNLVLEVSH